MPVSNDYVVDTYEEWLASDRKVKIRTYLHPNVSKMMRDPEGTRRVEYWNPHTQNFYAGMIYTQEELKKMNDSFYKNPQTIKIENITL